jgi:hypothetical protein
MNAVKSKGQKSGPENAFAKKALEAIAQIEREAEQRKHEQLESLREAKAAVIERLNELNQQLGQLDKAIGAITGRPVKAPGEVRQRRDWSDVRERVVRWMGGRSGQKFGAGDLIREFPELDGQVMSVFLRGPIEDGNVKTDVTEGVRRTKYYIEQAS